MKKAHNYRTFLTSNHGNAAIIILNVLKFLFQKYILSSLVLTTKEKMYFSCILNYYSQYVNIFLPSFRQGNVN